MINWRSLTLGTAVSVICITFLLHTVDLQRTRDALLNAHLWWLLITLACIGGSLLMRVWKWQLLFLPADRVSFQGALSSSLVGYMFNTILPGRVGELARASLVSQTDHVSVGRAIGTIFIEKLTDIFMLLILLGGLTLVMPLPIWITTAGVGALVTFGGLTVLFFTLSRFRAHFATWVARYVDPLPLARSIRPSRWVETILGSAGALYHPPILLLVAVTTAGLWLLALLQVLTALRAFDVDVPWTAALLLVVTTNLGMVVPSAPGYIGVYHYIVVLTLGLFAVDPAIALSVATVTHLLGFGSFTVAGATIFIVKLARQQYTLSQLWRWDMPVRAAAAPLE